MNDLHADKSLIISHGDYKLSIDSLRSLLRERVDVLETQESIFYHKDALHLQPITNRYSIVMAKAQKQMFEQEKDALYSAFNNITIQKGRIIS